jgi:RimJ/RimL family protein N-acetyltransferase
MKAADLAFSPMREQDLPTFRGWLLRPHVAHWWGEPESIGQLRADYVTDADLPRATRAYIVSLSSRPIGFIQSYVVMGSGGGWWEGETDPGARGIDQFLADAQDLGRGMGRAMIRAFVGRLFDDPAVTVVQTDPDPANLRAVRCYTAAGFEAVDHVDTPDGRALLMRCTRRSLARSAPDAR